MEEKTNKAETKDEEKKRNYYEELDRLLNLSSRCDEDSGLPSSTIKKIYDAAQEYKESHCED